MAIRCLFQKFLISAVIILLFSITFVNAQTIVKIIPLSNQAFWNYAYGLAADSTGLYISSSTSTTTNYNYGFIYTLDLNGAIVDSINPGRGYSQGLAFDGTNYFYIRRYTSVCTIMKLTKDGTLIDSLRYTSNRYLGGAAWDGTHLWISDYTSTGPSGGDAKLFKIDWSTKTIVDSISTIGYQPTGVAWDGEYIYYAMDKNGTEPNLNLIYVVDPISKDTIRTIPMPESQTTDSDPRGLAWDGNYLWLIARPVGGGTGKVLYKYDVKGGGTPGISVPTKYYDYGWVTMGDSASFGSSISSIGTSPLRIDSIEILYSSNYSTDLVTPLTIPAGSNQNFNILFRPLTYGVDSAHIVLYHNDITRPAQTIRVMGKGQYPSPFIYVPPINDYGTRRVGSTSKWSLTIENRGAQSLVITSGTFSTSNFYCEANTFPITIPPVSSQNVRVWFYPSTSGAMNDTLRLLSNASNLSEAKIALTGSGDPTPLAIGTPMWNYTVPKHPSSSTVGLVKGLRFINDITGDGKPDVIVSSENYQTIAINGNSSVDNDTLWAFSTYMTNYSAGSIGTTGDYSYQKAMAIASDLNADGYNDVVIGTGGGNEHVYAINGKTGEMLWTFGTDHPDSFGLGDFTGVDVSMDFDGDGVPDVLAAAAATQSGGTGGRRSLYLFNGKYGNLIWQAPLPGFTHAVAAIRDIDGDTIPDAIGTVGEAAYKISAFSGATGSIIWDFALTSTSGGGKELLVFPVDANNDDIIVAAFWGPVYRINPITGLEVWSTPTGNRGVMRMERLKDINSDGVDEVVIATLGGGTMCMNGANGNIIWSLPTGNTMSLAVVPDLNNDKYDDVIIAAQSGGTYIVSGLDGTTLATHSFGSPLQTREVAIVPDIDGNYSFELLAGSDKQHVVMLSGGLNAIPPGSIVAAVSIDAGWNLVSVPLVRDNNYVRSVFPSAIGGTTFLFNNGYLPVDTLVPGKGYWTKFPQATSQNVIGTAMLTVSVPVNNGWNIIGSVQNEVPAPSGGIISSNVYKYSNGYQITNTISPGKGYWVKASSVGNIVIGSTAKIVTENYDDYNSLTIVDKLGRTQTLYLTNESKITRETEYFEMPPLPPQDMFDARFASNRVLETYPDETSEDMEYQILLQSAEFPIELYYNLKNIEGKIVELLSKENNKLESSQILNGSGKLKIEKSEGNILYLKIGENVLLPKEYGISQNYPNPFNPKTTIKYQLPVDSKLTIKIYNLLGQEVKTLIDEIQEAGYKSVEWNGLTELGKQVASGIYFYRIDATGVDDPGKTFTQVKKMFLLK